MSGTAILTAARHSASTLLPPIPHCLLLPFLSLQIFPHGSTDALPYATMGSGSLNAMAVFEASYKDDMDRDEAMALAARAIRRHVFAFAWCCSTLYKYKPSLDSHIVWMLTDLRAQMTCLQKLRCAARHLCSGVYNDLGSGSNVDLCVITAQGVDYLRNYEFLATKPYTRTYPVVYPPGTARALHLLCCARICYALPL
jgi:20S proteasome subunit beta 2